MGSGGQAEITVGTDGNLYRYLEEYVLAYVRVGILYQFGWHRRSYRLLSLFIVDKGLFYIQFQIIQNKSKEEKDVHTRL